MLKLIMGNNKYFIIIFTGLWHDFRKAFAQNENANNPIQNLAYQILFLR